MSNSPVYTRIKIWVAGEILYASDLNSEFNNIITNTIPQDLGAYSGTVLQMQSVVSPGTVGAESLATTLAGELERIRYTILQFKQVFKGAIAQWYEALSTTLTSAFTFSGNILFSGIATFNNPPVFPALSITRAELALDAVFPTGALLPFAGAEAALPTGFLLCYGQAVNRMTYAALFTVIGTVFGAGNGSTTFNLPDLRGRFPLGKDDMGGVAAGRVAAATALAQAAGLETHILSTAEMPAHTHTEVGGGSVAVNASGAANVAAHATVNTGSTGGGGAHNNMPPYLTVNYIIRT
jgi:microcystin-dependent protein